MASFPCSICDEKFVNPKDLGTHILTAHCNDVQEDEDKKPNIEEIDKSPKDPIKESQLEVTDNNMITMKVDPIATVGEEIGLPRKPTLEEEKEGFMETDGEPAKFICLTCSKTYTSRYNIREVYE